MSHPSSPFARWPQLDRLFDEALDLSPAQRASYLNEVCGDDVDLRAELQRLLAADDASSAFLEDPDRWIGDLVEPDPTASGPVPTDIEEPLRAALSGRYEIQRVVGTGGMATVFLARDERHDRSVAVKVLRSDRLVPQGVDRFLREIEIAAGLRHPHILPLYDSGQADGFLYYVMPFVEGESLRDRLHRERQLPIDDALRLAREVADALSYAHSRGVVHRDIKPENILLESGHAVVADFGVAKAISVAGDESLTQAGMAIGTPAYMSPEHARAEPELDGRTDIYSLGCVLYEMLAGELPYSGTSAHVVLARKTSDPVPSLRVLRQSVSEAIDAVISRALAKVPADRFATAAQLRDALVVPDASVSAVDDRSGRGMRGRAGWIAGVISTVLLFGVIGSVAYYWTGTTVPFEERGTVLVTDFENRTGDSVFDESLDAAFTIGLQESRHVNVYPRVRIGDVLRRMQRDSVNGIDESLGSEVAVRENVPLVVVPSIDAVDTVYVLTTRVIDPTNGVTVRSRSERANGKSGVLPAVQALTRRLRRDLGEARRLTDGSPDSLLPVTTTSLEALRAWTAGLRLWELRQFNEASTWWNRAIELDSGFARAHQMLGGYYYWTNDRPRGDTHFELALGLLDRVTERERLSIQAGIYSTREDREASNRVLAVLLDRYPDDWAAWATYAYNHMRLGRYSEAVDAYREVLRSDSTDASTLINMATSFTSAGLIDSALVYYERAFDQEPDWMISGNLNNEYGFTYVKAGDLDAASSVFRRMLEAADGAAWGHRSLGLLDMLQGRYDDGAQRLTRAIAANRGRGHWNSEYRNLLYRAWAHRAKGRDQRLTRDLQAATTIADARPVETSWLAYLARFRVARGERDEAHRLLDSMIVRADERNQVDRVSIALVRGELARLDGRAGAAVEHLEPAFAVYPRPFIGEALADAYSSVGRLDDAIRVYEAVIRDESRSLGWEAQEPWVLAHYGLGRLYAMRGDTANALDAYGRLIRRWEQADDDLPTLIDTRQRIRQLRTDRAREF